MRQRKQKQKHWQLTRERFHIKDRRPPAEMHEEREIGLILADILHTESPADTLPKVLSERWSLIVGEQVASHTAPSALKNGVLSVDADHPGWLTEVRRMPKEHLVKKIMAIPGIPRVIDVRFRLDPSIQTWRNRT